MKVRRRFASRPSLEELEGRLVPSTLATTSTNWSGYAVTAARGSVTAVSASWVVPAVSGSGTAYSSDWVGIDGFNSSTVEQIGTDSDLTGGVPQYYAWYEMYPSGSVQIPLAVRAGDAMSASVTYGSGGFTLAITDTTTGKSFTTTQGAAGAQRSSAEWVVEAPSSWSGILPLADFGKVTFTGAQATVGGTSGAVDSFTASGEQVYSINMVSPRTGAAEDTTAALTDSGTPATSSFTVTDTATSTSTTTTPPPPRRWWWRSAEQAASVLLSANLAAALTSAGGSSSAGSGAGTTRLPAGTAPTVVAPVAPPAIGQLAGARLSADGAALTAGQADQVDFLPGSDAAGPRGSQAAQPSDAGATPAPSPAPPSQPAPAGGQAPLAPETTRAPVILPADRAGAEDEAQAGLLLALAAAGFWGLPSDEKRRRRNRAPTILHTWIF